MKYISLRTKQLYELDFEKKRNICPECSQFRKQHNQNQKCLEYHKDSNSAYCFNCESTFVEFKPFEGQTKEYKAPEYKNITELNQKAVDWFTGRMISQKSLKYMKVYSDITYMPQFSKDTDVICFPYFKNGKLINIKFRGPKKSFKLNPGSELIFWNIDCVKEYQEIIIVEGEIDLLTYIENGFKNVISVPNGAQKNLCYLDTSFELFEGKTIILSTDNDLKGSELKDEFIRRFGIEFCKTVNFQGCKDANEYFVKFGGIKFKDAVKEAKEIPIKGIYKADDLLNDIYSRREHGIQAGKEIGIEEIDKFCTWEVGFLAVVTGIPGSGKSEVIDFIISKLNFRHGWKAAFFTPENYPLIYHYDKIFSKICGKKFNEVSEEEMLFVHEYINGNYFYILNEDNMKLENILLSAKSLIKSKGIKILVIDPYNRIDHEVKKQQSETMYISEFLDKLGNFARFNNILIFLVAHPRKIERGSKISLYDISGSAHFFNKCDYGITVERNRDENGLMNNVVNIAFQKIKQRNFGSQGISELKYNYNNGRYETSSVDSWDNSNWLIKDENINLNDLESEFNFNSQTDVIPF